jgi:hypothetical protein
LSEPDKQVIGGRYILHEQLGALDILAAAHGILWEQAIKIPDEETRRAFLERVPAHRELARAFGRTSESWP